MSGCLLLRRIASKGSIPRCRDRGQRWRWQSTASSSAANRDVHVSTTKARKIPEDGLSLGDFVAGRTTPKASTPHLSLDHNRNNPRHSFHIKTFGCQMNVNDSDIVRSLLLDAGLRETATEEDASILLTNTCAIREGAEEKVWHRMRELRGLYNKRRKKQNRKLVGVLGCMAERLKEDLFQDGLADLVVGPDAYRDLPRLIADLTDQENLVEQAVNVQLSLEETYADITPIRRNPDDVSAFVSIQRGCANRCSFCIVPFTRGQERSRPYASILDEVRALHFEEGVKEITLLGQNVNSYHDQSPEAIAQAPDNAYTMSNDGFRSRIRREGAGYFFADLVEAVSDISPELRVRFTSPHPKDYPPELLSLMAERPNVCNCLHMPAQSGSSSMLKRMKRGYSREAYLDLIDSVHAHIPDVAITSDFIAGFCGETEEEHRDTVSLMEQVRYDQAFMFAYSLREKTHAHRVLQDDVPEEVKQRRLREIIDTFRYQVQRKNEEREVGRLRLVLLEGESKRSKPGNRTWHGRTDQNKRVLLPVEDDDLHNSAVSCWSENVLDSAVQAVQSGGGPGLILSPLDISSTDKARVQAGDYAVVEVTEAKGHTLRGRLLCSSSIAGFERTGLSKMDGQSLAKGDLVKQLMASQDEDTATESIQAAT